MLQKCLTTTVEVKKKINFIITLDEIKEFQNMLKSTDDNWQKCLSELWRLTYV